MLLFYYLFSFFFKKNVFVFGLLFFCFRSSYYRTLFPFFLLLFLILSSHTTSLCAKALRSSMDLEVEFHRQQQSTWEQWQLQQEQAASEAKEKAGTKRGGGGGGSGGSGAAAAAAAAATKPRRQESSLDEECPICFDTFEDASKTPCNHIFCKVCILDWLSHTESCPMCRADMSVGQLVPK